MNIKLQRLVSIIEFFLAYAAYKQSFAAKHPYPPLVALSSVNVGIHTIRKG